MISGEYMYKIDLNCDLGESFGAYTIGADSVVIPHISSANVACGYHAGDAVVMRKTVELCSENNVSVGAHPGFPDLAGFGRRNLAASPDEVYAYTLYQIGALDAFCRANGVSLQHVKPHGAMYNMAGKDNELAKAIVNAIYDYNKELILLGLSGSCMIKAAEEKGLPFACEVFADRAYEADGSLRARGKEGSMITDTDEAIARVIKMITKHSVMAYSGEEIEINAHSVCVHGDGAKAIEFVKALQKAFSENDIEVVSLSEVIG